jgi:hypothetical protein
VDPVPDPLLHKSGSAGNQTWDLWICSQELWPLDHTDGSQSHKHLTKLLMTMAANSKTLPGERKSDHLASFL